MSIASRIEAMEGHIADDYEVLELAGADLTDVDKNIINLKQTWQERLLYFINNGTDEVWNNWEKVTGSGTSSTLNGTVEAPMKVELKPSELSQEQEEPSAGKEVIDTSIIVNDLNPSKISKIILKGNTYQETTTGKNLLNKNNFVPTSSATTITTLNTGIRIENTSSGYGAKIQIDNLKTDTDYYLQYQWTNISHGINRVVVFAGAGTSTQLIVLNNLQGGTFNTGNNTSINIWFYANAPAVATVEYTEIQLEEGSTATSYEEYTGGQPSPSPDYPQDIEVVAGENTVTVSNGDNTQSQTYTMSLGTLELYKIGDYQDLFFKNVADSEYYDSTLNENSWYLKKMTGKFTLGNVSWYSYDEREIVATAISNGVFLPPLEYSSGYVNCLPLISSSAISNSSEDAEKTGFYIGAGGWVHVQIPISLLPTRDAAGVKSWLSTNNAVLYYQLATPQNIEIQNQTLINQLEALYNATTYSTTKINTSTSNLLPYIDLRYNITTGSSPSPTNPSDIHAVSGDNSVVVGNKNLINEIITNSRAWTSGVIGNANGYSRTDYILVEPNTDYYIQHTLGNDVGFVGWYYDKDKNSISNISRWGQYDISFSFKTPSNAKYVIINFRNQTINATPPMLNIGTSAMPYVPHQEQSLPLNLGDLEYCKIGDYEDLFFKNVVGSTYYDSTLELDKWYLRKIIGKVVLNGTENWGKSSRTTVNRYYAGLFTVISNNYRKDILSNNFTCITPNQSDNDNIGMSKWNYSGLMINFDLTDTNFDTLEKFKNYLSTHNTIVYYVQSSRDDNTNPAPTYTLLNNTLQTQLENIQKALSYDGQTNVSQENNDLPFVLSLSALKDLRE